MNDENPNLDKYPLGEPSVLDYIKSLFYAGNGKVVDIPSMVETVQEQPSDLNLEPSDATPFPWRSLLALAFALIAQNAFEPPQFGAGPGLVLYLFAFVFWGWAIYRREWTLPTLAPTSEGTDPATVRLLPFIASILLFGLAFLLLGGSRLVAGVSLPDSLHLVDNQFTWLNTLVWLLATGSLIWAFWVKRNDPHGPKPFIQFNVWVLLFIAATVLIVFFRFYQTVSVPPEPFSDHAEKLLDVYDVSQGQTHIFFPRNTGREAFQMYWTLLVANIFGTGLSYLSLKLGTAILGFLTLPYIYLLGKEIGGPRVGFIAFLLAGIGYWPNVISRVGLRFPLYPLFTAPTLFYLLRGLRTRNRNDFILSGIFLGIGLHGYSPMRIVPFVVVAAFFVYWIHAQSKGTRKELPVWLAMLALVSMFVFLPLLRYWLANPGEFGFRAMTRLEGVEQPLPGPAGQIFLSNFWNAIRMFNYDDGEIWVHSVVHRPALDVISAALFLIGIALVLVRYLRRRHWLDLFLLISIPLLMLPSILSLAFPAENPALNRAGAAYIPAFIIAALAFDGLLTSFGRGMTRNVVMWAVTGILFLVCAFQNYDLVFNQYYTSFLTGSWNSSDMGRTIKEFQQTYGRTDTVWIVPFPYWVDTRLPAAWAGIPNRDMAMWRENLPSTVESPGPKLFIVKADLDRPDANDQETLNVLESLYPNGQLRMFDSEVDGHDFWIFTVPSN